MTDTPTALPDAPHRAIRSFVKRGGRITVAQQRALAELWPRYGAAAGSSPLDLDALFGRRAPRTLEIGFGDGETLVALAAAHPERDYLGLEVHAPGVGHCLLRAAESGLGNVRVVQHDAVEVLEHSILPRALDEVLIYFPDPWPKKRHHKRRLVQPDFTALAASRLAPGGRLHAATDWQEYAEHMLAVLEATPGLANLSPGFSDRPEWRPETKFERRGRRLGHGVRDLLFVKE